MPDQVSLFGDVAGKPSADHLEARAQELRAAGVTCHWLLLTELECQALLDDMVPTLVKVQLAKTLKKEKEEEQWFG